MKNKITCIKQNKTNDKYSVFINNKFSFSITGTDILYYKLKENEEISDEKFNHITNNVVYNEARDKALRFLAYKARTYKEVLNKLNEEGYTDEIIYKVMDLLTSYSYIDDYKYTLSYIKYMLNSKSYGKIRIKYELKQKGIQDNIINKAFEELDFNEIDNILKLLNKKLKNGIDIDYKEKKRVFDYISRRGFTYEDINTAFTIFKEGYN